MPYETVQYPKTDTTDGTEVSVHWSKGSHVQLQVERHVWAKAPEAFDDMTDTPPHPEPFPVGTIRANDDQSQAAFRVDGLTSDDHDRWVIVRSNAAVETCTTEQIADWKVVSYGDLRPTRTWVWTDELTRTELNKLIRTLRRARDDAYGSDA